MILAMEQVETEPMIMDGMVFRPVTVTAMVVSASLVATVTGGVLRSTLQTLLGIAICTTAVPMFTEAAAVRDSVFLSVASGINLSLSII